MFSVSPAEFIVIAMVALIVVGPTRLVEMSRKAGQFAGRLRAAADDLRRGLESEVDDVVAPFREARTQLAATGKELKETAQGELKWIDTPRGAEEDSKPDSNSKPDAEKDSNSKPDAEKDSNSKPDAEEDSEVDEDGPVKGDGA